MRSTVWHYLRMTKTIRALDRALHIVETLARQESCSLADLHRLTELPKPTLLRLLKSLVARGYVRQSVIDGRYSASIILPDTTGHEVRPELVRLAELAMPHVVAMTRAIGWPSDLYFKDSHHMTLVDTTRPISPFHVPLQDRNARLNFFGSGTGLACLSVLPDAQIKALFNNTAPEMIWRPERFGLTWRRLQSVLEQARSNGYASRLSTAAGTNRRSDGMRSIAVALTGKNGPIGAINLLWPIAYKSERAFARDHLGTLQATARKIETELSDQP